MLAAINSSRLRPTRLVSNLYSESSGAAHSILHIDSQMAHESSLLLDVTPVTASLLRVPVY
jgi:hypothetical protein